MITLHVTGTPAPKGSARAMNIAGKARLIASSSRSNEKAQAAWVRAVHAAIAPNLVPIAGPVSMSVTFFMQRPRGHYGTGKNSHVLKPSAPEWPAVAPDCDKLLRCTCDALSKRVYSDDARIVYVTAAKQYVSALHGEGAEIRVWSAQAQQEAA